MLQVPHFAFKYARLIYCQINICTANISRPLRFEDADISNTPPVCVVVSGTFYFAVQLSLQK